MANPKPQDSQLADSANKPMIGSQQTKVADLTIAYGTDDPGITTNGVINIADGDAVAGLAETAEEIVAKINAILDVLEAHGLMSDT